MIRNEYCLIKRVPIDICSILCIVISIIVSANNAIAEELWRGASYGMSVIEVLDINKDAKIIDNGSKLHNGALELVRIDDLEIINESFRVCYYFKNNKLDQVTLSLNKERPFGQIIIVYEEIANVLRSKYGKEISNRIDKISVLRQANANWTNGKVNIRLAAIGVSENPAVLNIVYQVRFSTEAEKL